MKASHIFLDDHLFTYLSLGWIPECRGATQPQWIQGGSSTYLLSAYAYLLTSFNLDGDPIVGEFFVKYVSKHLLVKAV
jgi:hypothetical protein